MNKETYPRMVALVWCAWVMCVSAFAGTPMAVQDMPHYAQYRPILLNAQILMGVSNGVMAAQSTVIQRDFEWTWLPGYATQSLGQTALATQELSSTGCDEPHVLERPMSVKQFAYSHGIQQCVSRYDATLGMTNQILIIYGVFADTTTAHDVFCFVTSQASIPFRRSTILEKELVYLPDEVLFAYDGALKFRQGAICIGISILGGHTPEGAKAAIACANALLTRIRHVTTTE